jgi:hypothetical protein
LFRLQCRLWLYKSGIGIGIGVGIDGKVILAIYAQTIVNTVVAALAKC